MTREEAMDIFEHNWTRLVNADYTEEELNKAIEMAIKALEQEPCEDAISRKAVLDLVVANHTELNGVNVVMYSPFYKDIAQLQSVNPQNTKERDTSFINKPCISIGVCHEDKIKVLDKIQADVEQYQADCDLSCSDDSNCRTCNNITFGTIYQIIDKYRKGDKE